MGRSLGSILLTVCAALAVLAQAPKIPAPVAPKGEAVFRLVFEVRAQSRDLSSDSKVEVRLAPGPLWHGSFGGYRHAGFIEAQDARTPAALYQLRGGLAGLRVGERMCFGVVGHSGVAHASDGAPAIGPNGGPNDTDWMIEGDAARFERTERGGVLVCAPMFYSGDSPAYGLLTPGAYDYAGGGDAQYQELITFRFTQEELQTLDRVMKVRSASLTSQDGTVTQNFSTTLSAAPPPDETEVSVEAGEGYLTWMPKGNVDKPAEPGSDPLKITITVRKKGDSKVRRQAFLKVSLPYVSKNKGICGNHPQKVGEEEGLRFREKDFPAKDGLLYKDRTHLETDIPVEEVEFYVRSYDFGAWGTLRVTATDENGKDLKVKVRGLEKPDLDIPLDEDSNRIADAWQRARTYGRKGGDDDEEVAGQDQRGDGITLYNEYRGLVVLDGKARVHRRLSPTEKEMFILDPDESFPDSLWKDRSGVQVLRLDESLADAAGNAEGGPLVDFNASDRDTHPFFALRVKTVQGDADASPPTDKDGNKWPSSTSDPSAPLMAYAVSNGTLRSADYIKVFPDRARLMVNHYRQWLDMGLKDPVSGPGQDLRDPKNLFTLDEAFQAWTQLENPQAQEALVRKMLNVFFIHEVGHICGGLPDHRMPRAPEGHKEEARACFMWNPSLWDLRRMIVFTALGRGDSNFAYAYSNFCKDLPVAGFRCYRSLKIKDW